MHVQSCCFANLNLLLFAVPVVFSVVVALASLVAIDLVGKKTRRVL